MPQISLYVCQNDLTKIKKAALYNKKSISKWASDKLLSDLEPSYPIGYEKLCGSISDDTFDRPKQIDFSKDSKRETL